MKSLAFLSSILLSVANASPLARNNRRQDTSGAPCSKIAPLVQEYLASNPNTTTPIIPAAPAWECIQSVPLNTSAALELLSSIRPFARWQSTNANLPNPPAEYVEKIQPAYDNLGALDDIENSLKSEEWTKEYEFGIALYEAFHQVHDGHYYFNPDVVGAVFNWARDMPLVSVSEDGVKLPAPFAYTDILSASMGNSSFVPSAIAKIDGRDATDFLLENSQIGSLQDRDALYNTNFYNLAQISLGSNGIGAGMFVGGGRGRLIYPGPTTSIEFLNGTTLTLQNKAKVLVSFDGIKTGEDLYKKYFAYPDLSVRLQDIGVNATAASYGPNANVAGAAAAVPAPGYPVPVIKQEQNLIGGYYVPGPGYEDVAVLTVPSFVSDEAAEVPFQQVGEQFLAQSVKDGKTKLIIDVSANAGGTILQGYDLFKQLFPMIDAYAAGDRFRAFESTDLLGQVFSEEAGKYPRVSNQSDEVLNILAGVFNYRSDLEADSRQPFKNWGEKIGFEEHQGDTFTSRFRWNFADPLIRWNSGGIDIHGYGPLSEYSYEPFKPENIVVVYDGYCASTCTIFSELMRRLAGIKTIAMGGRPSNSIIQAVGGVKGTNNLAWDYIQYQVETAFNVSSPEMREKLLDSELMEYDNYLPFYRSTGGATGINFRDGIRKGDATDIPLQFVYEEADCRLFYTPEMTVDASAVWKKAADTKWGDGDCVAGGFKAEGGFIGKSSQNAKRQAPAMSTIAPMKGVSMTLEWIQGLRDGFKVSTNPKYSKSADGIMYP